MQCDIARDLVGAYVDGELSGAERQAMAEHIASCPTCAAEADALRRVGEQLRVMGRAAVPVGLSDRIRSQLAQEPITAMPATAVKQWNSGALRQMAAVLAACVLSSALTWGAMTSGALTGRGVATATVRIEHDVVAAHIRSLLQDSPIQVASSDSHTVKPWFTGRIDFAPEVRDFASDGFPLIGGRIDYIGDRRVGAVVYKRNLHVVNVFLWPAAAAEPAIGQRHVAKGYNVLSWSKDGLAYWAISDLNLEDLKKLQSLL